jgi:hypothetical protein
MASFDMKVKTTGIIEFGVQIDSFGGELPGFVEGLSMSVAKLVADEARPGVPVDSGHAAASVRAIMDGAVGTVQGGLNVPYYAWLEYGGPSGKHGSNRRPVVAEGRYIYPAYQRNISRIQDLMVRELTKLIDEQFK